MVGHIMKISVIIPVYNCEKCIRQTLDCIRTQTFPARDLEVIVYLDGCTDSTADEIAIYAQDWPKMNLRVIHNTVNQGASVARNLAVAAACGEYIHFMDADDVINTDFYQKLYDAVRRADADIAVSEFINERYPHNSILFNREIVLSVPQDKIDATHVDIHGYSVRYLIRREFWNHNRFMFPPYMKYCEDMLIMTKMVYYSNCIILVPNAQYLYKWRQNSMLTTRATRKIQARFYHRARCDVYIFMSTFGLNLSRKKYKFVAWRLFGILPIFTLRFRTNNNDCWVYLFGLIPVMLVRQKVMGKRPPLK